MDREWSRGRAPVAATLAIAGGALLAIGSFLPWGETTFGEAFGGGAYTSTGVDGSDGWITLLAGAVVLLAGAAFAAGRGRRPLAVVVICAALVGGGLGLFDALTGRDRVLDSAAGQLADELGTSVQDARAFLDAAVDAGQFGVSLGVGLFTVIAGGALGLVGGVMRAGRPAEAVPAPPAPAFPAPEIPAAGLEGPEGPPMPPPDPGTRPPG
jgi:hypothetical protein